MITVADLSHDAIERVFFEQMKMLSLQPKRAALSSSSLLQELDDADVYTEDGLCDALDNDEMSLREEAFMQGYLAS